MSEFGEILLAGLMLDFQESPSFNCARRIWLLCYHYEMDTPQVVMDVFLKQLESDDEAWGSDSKHHKKIELAGFVEFHMSKQLKEKGKASRSAALEAFVEYQIEKCGTGEDLKTLRLFNTPNN